MSDPKQDRVLLEAAERDVSALRGMGDVAVFADDPEAGSLDRSEALGQADALLEAVRGRLIEEERG